MEAKIVAINTEALNNPDIIQETSKVFGSQCIVASIDIVREDGQYFIYNNGKVFKEIDLIEHCQKLAQLGAGEVLINNVTDDGAMKGADIHIADKVSQSISIPTIYAGGYSGPKDCASVAKTKVSGVGVSSIFHFTSITPLECKEEMHKNGIPVRL